MQRKATAENAEHAENVDRFEPLDFYGLCEFCGCFPRAQPPAPQSPVPAASLRRRPPPQCRVVQEIELRLQQMLLDLDLVTEFEIRLLRLIVGLPRWQSPSVRI